MSPVAEQAKNSTMDGRSEGRMQKYQDFWDSDLKKEEKTHNANRLEHYTEVINGSSAFSFLSLFSFPHSFSSPSHRIYKTHKFLSGVTGYYDGATLLYEWCWAGSFHFSRFYKGESFSSSLARHEHYLAAQMGLRPGMRVLDVGCGVGGPAREIARFADVNIVGINNNEFQVGRATRYVKHAGLQDQISFVKGDFMNLVAQFGENSFDAGEFLASCLPPSLSWCVLLDARYTDFWL